MDRRLIRELQRIVGKEHVYAGPVDIEVYSYDASLARRRPGGVVFPANTHETVEIVRAASRAGVPYVPRGFGTNLSGGSIAPEGGLVVCLSRLNRIVSIVPERRAAQVQPGVTNLELQNALAPLGFFYAPDPASQKVATLGGNVGENSGGPRCVKYGVTRNHILGMEIVLPEGEVLRVGGVALDPPGYDLCGIMVGSEGTLGIVTEITVRILPSPESVVTLLAIYDDIADAARSVSGIIAQGMVPAALEMMDAPIMRAVEESFPCGYPLDAAAVLIIELDGPASGLKAQAEKIEQICSANGCRNVRQARDSDERNLLWAGRRGAFGAIARLAPNYLVADCTVPRTKLPEALGCVAAVARRYGLSHGNVFHAGDGNLHPLLFFDSRELDQVDRVHEAGREIMKECVALGGTITGEHGVGLEKIDAMRMLFTEDDLDVQRTLRLVFDRAQLLNPGKVIPEACQRASLSEQPEQEGPDTTELVPTCPEEACSMIRRAFCKGTALLPQGGGRWRLLGNMSHCTLVPLRSSGLATLIEYDSANQIATVGAGMPLATLQAVFADHGQWLPLRPFLGMETTVGGMTALGACGPERLRYGTPRDLILGLRFVSGKGLLISTGGKVVKNVAGYELGRLLVGSAGTLGFLTELTFRVSPRPEVCCAVSACGLLESISTLASEVLCSNMDPAFVTGMPVDTRAEENAMAFRTGLWRLTVGFEGFGEAVDAQAKRCIGLLSRKGLVEEALQEYSTCNGMFARNDALLNQSAFLLRVDVPLDRVTDLILGIIDAVGVKRIFVDFGCGRVRASLSGMPEGSWNFLCGLARGMEGHVVLEKATYEFKENHDVFGTGQPTWKLMHRIKEALDPNNIFSPGRLPGRK